MKIIIRILFVVVILCISVGYYLKNSGNSKGDVVVGIGVLILAFLLMPLFIYNQSKGKDLSRYTFNNQTKDKNISDKQ